ncbi:CHAD domain-containing protein [Ancylobacter moscoviensis]
MPENLGPSRPNAVDAAADAARRPAGPLDASLAQASGEALAALATANPERAVHDLRKAFKRLRALLRLAQASEDKAVAAEARRLRRALAGDARQLAGARDVSARRAALDDLQAKGHLSAPQRRAAGRSLTPPARQDREGADAGLSPHRAGLAARLAELSAAAPQLGAALHGKSLVAALTAEYGKARRLGRKADPEDENGLHELRKAVVAQRYQMELLVPAWPALGAAWVAELQRLRDKLGKHHDLCVLRARLDERISSRPPAWRAPLIEAIGARQLKLAHSALRLHGRLFTETPKAFRRRIASYMSAVSDGK